MAALTCPFAALSSRKKKKNAREGSLEENPEVDNVFTISMDSPECLQILFNCQTSRIIIKDVEIKGEDISENFEHNVLKLCHILLQVLFPKSKVVPIFKCKNHWAQTISS